MTEFKSFHEVLAYAIQREQEAQEFYTEMATNAKYPHMRKVFEEFAAEEKGHRAKLRAIGEGSKPLLATARVLDLKIADHRAQVVPTGDMTYDRALLLAMQREKAAFQLYSELAEVAGEETLRNLFLALAQEEAKHKLRFELEYDREFMGEN
jgi:rubrerythrin